MTREPADPKTEVRMAAAGPLMSFVIAGFLLALSLVSNYVHGPIAVTATLRYGGLINAVLGVFNLLPAFPLDGGRVLRGSIWEKTRSLYRSTVSATRISEYLSYLIMGLGLVSVVFGSFLSGIWLIFIGWFIKSGAEESMRRTIIDEALSGVTVEEIMAKDLITVPPDITVQQLVANYFLVHRHGGYPVIENGNLSGIITMQGARSIPKETWETTTVREAMVPSERTVTLESTASALDALNKMAAKNIGRILIVKDGSLVGIVTRGDLMRIIRTKQELGLA